MTEPDNTAKWAALSAPFAVDEIEKLPKQVSKNDTEKAQCRQGTKASADGFYCGGYHARSIHLDYIGHAGIRMRLSQVDPGWSWAPLATTEAGTPLFADQGMWITLTVLGVTKIGYGDAGGKSPGPNAVKEIIGDALRNAAMSFGVATYLWSKSDAAARLKTDEGAGQLVTPESETRVTRPAAPARQASRPAEPKPAPAAGPSGPMDLIGPVAMSLKLTPEQVSAMSKDNLNKPDLSTLTREEVTVLIGMMKAEHGTPEPTTTKEN